MNVISRKWYALAATLLFLVLLLIFLFGDAVPFIRVTFGDYLVVFLLYAGLLMLFPKLKPWFGGSIILAIAFTVETLQMGVIQKFFDTESPLVAATLGSTFDPHDLLAYTLGVITVGIVDFLVRKNKVSKR